MCLKNKKQARKGFWPLSAMWGLDILKILGFFRDIVWIFLDISWKFFGIVLEFFGIFTWLFWEFFLEDFWEEFFLSPKVERKIAILRSATASSLRLKKHTN